MKVFKTRGSLMQVKSIAECSLHSAIFLTCIKQVPVLKNYFCLLFEWLLKADLTVIKALSQETFHTKNESTDQPVRVRMMI